MHYRLQCITDVVKQWRLHLVFCSTLAKGITLNTHLNFKKIQFSKLTIFRFPLRSKINTKTSIYIGYQSYPYPTVPWESPRPLHWIQSRFRWNPEWALAFCCRRHTSYPDSPCESATQHKNDITNIFYKHIWKKTISSLHLTFYELDKLIWYKSVTCVNKNLVCDWNFEELEKRYWFIQKVF